MHTEPNPEDFDAAIAEDSTPAASSQQQTSDTLTEEAISLDTATPTGDAPAPTPDAAFDLATLPEPVRKVLEAREAENQRLKAEAAKVTADNKALAGRVGPMQKRLQEMERRLQQDSTRTDGSKPNPGAKPGAESPKDTASRMADSYFDSAEWKQFEKDYPLEAKVQRTGFEHVLENARAPVTALQAEIAKLREEFGTRFEHVASRVEKWSGIDAERQLEDAQTTLREKHPDWNQHFMVYKDDPSKFYVSDDLAPFYDQSPESVQAMFHSSNVSDVLWVMDQFKAWRGQGTSPARTEEHGRAAAIDSRRKETLARGTQPALGSHPTAARTSVTGGPEDFDREIAAG